MRLHERLEAHIEIADFLLLLNGLQAALVEIIANLFFRFTIGFRVGFAFLAFDRVKSRFFLLDEIGIGPLVVNLLDELLIIRVIRACLVLRRSLFMKKAPGAVLARLREIKEGCHCNDCGNDPGEF